MSTTTQAGAGPVSDGTMAPQALLPIDDPKRSLNDSALPSVMIWAGGDAYDDLTMPGVTSRSLDLDSCALAVGIYRAMTDAHMRNIATLGPSAALAPPAVVPESVRRLSEALDGLSEAAEKWRSRGGDEAHRILPLIHPSFNAVYQAYKPLRGILPTLSTPSGRPDTPPAGGGAVDGFDPSRKSLDRLTEIIALCSMRPAPGSSHGKAWEEGAQRGWKWAWREAEAAAPAAPEPAAGGEREIEVAASYGIIDPDYAKVFTIARCLAWAEGYALMMHGSFTRDLDLLAVPWTEKACEPDHLVRRIEDAAGLKLADTTPGQKPHGRLAWTLLFPGFGDPRFVDIGVMPRSILSTPSEAGAAGSIRYQFREIGEGEGWIDCSRESYEALSKDPHIDTRTIDSTVPGNAGG